MVQTMVEFNDNSKVVVNATESRWRGWWKQNEDRKDDDDDDDIFKIKTVLQKVKHFKNLLLMLQLSDY